MTSAVIIIADLEKSSYGQGMKEGVINSVWTGLSVWIWTESQKNLWRRGELGLSLRCLNPLMSPTLL